ncbi:hypothetical protein UFOVP326_73 [uncultured Caudovirales phage]|uniref:Uncharacterized protein n=1 Tax=uncultured Caudovirales phage TaxID=2100421 RepID=A0A6J5LTG5_9CAUD|nr:hypothetical protein UFOVP326_73 [uncultured Caudovirales phage]
MLPFSWLSRLLLRPPRDAAPVSKSPPDPSWRGAPAPEAPARLPFPVTSEVSPARSEWIPPPPRPEAVRLVTMGVTGGQTSIQSVSAVTLSRGVTIGEYRDLLAQLPLPEPRPKEDSQPPPAPAAGPAPAPAAPDPAKTPPAPAPVEPPAVANDDGVVLHVADVAQRMGFTPRTLHAAVRSGAIPHTKTASGTVQISRRVCEELEVAAIAAADRAAGQSGMRASHMARRDHRAPRSEGAYHLTAALPESDLVWLEAILVALLHRMCGITLRDLESAFGADETTLLRHMHRLVLGLSAAPGGGHAIQLAALHWLRHRLAQASATPPASPPNTASPPPG